MKKAEKIRVYDIPFKYGLNLPDVNDLFYNITPTNKEAFLNWKIDFIIKYGNIYLYQFNVNSFRPVYNSKYKKALRGQIKTVNNFLSNTTNKGKKYAK